MAVSIIWITFAQKVSDMSTSSNTKSSPKLIVTIDDTTMLNKIKNAIKMLRGVGSISVVTPQKSDLDLAHEDVKAGRVTNWNSVDELFDTVLKWWNTNFIRMGSAHRIWLVDDMETKQPRTDFAFTHYWYSLWHFWKEKAIIRIHKGSVSWSGETIQLRTEVTEQLRQNYLVSRGIHPSSHTAINKNSLPQISSAFMHYIIASE